MSAVLGSLAVPTTCARCDVTRHGARPNWGSAWLCPTCKADAMAAIWDQRYRKGELDPEEMKALRRLERLIAAHENTEQGSLFGEAA